MKVYQAINRVQAELAKDGIVKDRKNTSQGYSFRGIDDVYNAISPMLSRNGLCILPRMLARTCEERQTQKGGTLFFVTVEAEFDFVCAEDGSKHTVKTFGEAMDSGDKATNKAMSAAYKYAAFQSFAIPTEGDNDADAHTHEPVIARIHPAAGVMESMSAEMRDELQEAAAVVGEYMDNDDVPGAVDFLARKGYDNDTKTALWTLLPSKTRTAIKKLNSEKAA